MTAAPRTTPLKPNWPGPALGGMNCPPGLPAVTQCAVVTKGAAAAMNSTMMTSLTATMTVLTREDSRTPRTRSAVMMAMISIAGALMTAPVVCQACCAAS